MLWAILFAIVGLVGFFTLKILFWIGGGVSFLFLVFYLYSNTKTKDLEKYEELKIQQPDSDQQSLIKQKKFVDFVGRFVTYGLVTGIMFFFFKWDAFCWIGIVFGLFYIPEVIHFIKTGELRK